MHSGTLKIIYGTPCNRLFGKCPSVSISSLRVIQFDKRLRNLCRATRNFITIISEKFRWTFSKFFFPLFKRQKLGCGKLKKEERIDIALEYFAGMIYKAPSRKTVMADCWPRVTDDGPEGEEKGEEKEAEVFRVLCFSRLLIFFIHPPILGQ